MKLPSFNPHLDKEASPIGLARYLHILFVNMWQFLVCNILFVLCSIPLITLGPSLIALTRVCCTVLRGKRVSPCANFFEAFKSNFRVGLLLSLAIPLYIWTLYMGMAYFQLFLESGSFLFRALSFLLAYFLLNAYMQYLLPLLAYMNSDMYSVMRNAFILCFSGKLYTLFGALISALIFVCGILFLPKTLPLYITVYFSLFVYNMSFFGWKIADRDIFTPYYEAHPEESDRDGY